MKQVIVGALIAMLFLSGCNDNVILDDGGTRTVRSSTGGQYIIVCIDGVEYLKRYEPYSGYMSPHFRPDATLYTCDGK